MRWRFNKKYFLYKQTQAILNVLNKRQAILNEVKIIKVETVHPCIIFKLTNPSLFSFFHICTKNVKSYAYREIHFTRCSGSMMMYIDTLHIGYNRLHLSFSFRSFLGRLQQFFKHKFNPVNKPNYAIVIRFN